MTAVKFLLEHFYYGQLVHHGERTGDPRVLASSPGVTAEIAAAAVERVTLPPLESAGSWALVRGKDKQVQFVLVQTQGGIAGGVMAHYVLPTPDVLRAVAGNLRLLSTVLEDQLPTYESLGDPLKPLELPQTQPLSVDEQIDDILDLMTHTKNRIPVIETLLASIVQGVQLIVRNAPPELQPRIDFIEGLLVLIPRSARFGVTFTTHSVEDMDINAQVRFYEGDDSPPNTVIYDWKTGKVSGEAVEDNYSRFVTSQLRLDAELVIQRTAAMTPIAAWRINQGDRLADALGYASRRLRLDEALRQNQPVNIDEVAQALKKDPTLDNGLLSLYAEHLMKFSLAMRDTSQADPIVTVLADHPDLAGHLAGVMRDANEPEMVYETLSRWSTKHELAPETAALMQESSLSVLQGIVDRKDGRALDTYLRKLQFATTATDAMPNIIRTALPLAVRDARLADRLFVLAAKFLSDKQLDKLMEQSVFVEKLPNDVRRLWLHITQDAPYDDAAGALIAIGERYGASVMLHFLNIAVKNGHTHLLTTGILRVLRDYAFAGEGENYDKQMLPLLDIVEEGDLKALESPGPLYLLQIRLALGDYYTLGAQMIRQSVELYPGDRQEQYLKLVEKLFMETPLDADDIPTVLWQVRESGIKSAPFVTASIAALNRQRSTPELDDIAEDAGETLFENPGWLEHIPPSTILALLTYHASNKQVSNTARVSTIVPRSAARHPQGSVKVMVAMYKRMKWHETTYQAALQMLRAYVREAKPDDARQAINVFGQELGAEVRNTLENAFILRRFMADYDIETYAKKLSLALGFLTDTAQTYLDPRRAPEPPALKQAIKHMPGVIDEYDALSEAVLRLGRSINALAKHYGDHRARDEARHLEALLSGKSDTRSALDVFYTLGGYFARGKRLEASLQPSFDPFRSADTTETLRDAILAADQLLVRALDTFEKSDGMNAVRDEIDSAWGMLPDATQGSLRDQLAADLQRLPDVVKCIAEQGDARLLDPVNSAGKRIDSGRATPKSTLGMYRYLYAYFKQQD